MKIAIIGTGGVGGYFGGKLAKAGNDVTFLARGKHLETIVQNGLMVKSILGDFHIEKVNTTDTILDIQQPDLILIAVKAWQVKEVREDIKAILSPESLVLPLQNGVMAASELAEVIDEKYIVGGLCRIISKIEAPGVIHHMASKPSIVFGNLFNTPQERLNEIQNLFQQAEIESTLSEDIEVDIWKKFIFICLGGLMTITKTTCGELRAVPETRKMMIDLLTEIFVLSKKMGVNTPLDVVEKTVSFFDTLAYDATFSLTRDVWENKPSEIDYQNGTVVRLGERFGVSTPVNRFVYECILPSELKAKGINLKSNPI